MLGRLDDRERRILVSRYEIGGAKELTLEQLGKELGITKERVRQIQSKAQNRLRKFALSAKDFFEEDHHAHTILHRPADRLLAPRSGRMGQRRRR
ncbi:MAG TPA: sigma factor-like helix-turn-helix DNA-binding protein [Isosphaeraceae bacterium]|nr:sigma factor-like helix-turn-helix DNA-binding protein [Isosphaeraceae bacterium]